MAALAVVAMTTACSVLLDLKSDQCQTTEDCIGKGAAFADTTCDPEFHACRQRAHCKNNAECSAGGTPSHCRKDDGRCIPIVSEDCATVSGPIERDDAIIVGTMSPLTGPLSEVGVPVQQSVDLALKEISAQTTTLPLDSANRPLAVVRCDEANDGTRAAVHLAELEASAIIGPFGSSSALRISTEVTVPNGILLLSPGATAPSVTRASGGKLVWRTAASDTNQAKTLSQIIPLVESAHRTAWEIPDAPDGLIRVAMIVRGDSYGIELAQTAIDLGLEFNGRSLGQNGPFFSRFDYGDPLTTKNIDYAAIVAGLIKFEPNIVILLTGAEGTSEIVVPLEKQFPVGKPKPWYVIAHGARTPSLLAVANVDDDLRRRMRGTMPFRASPAFDAFDAAYRAAYGAPANIYGMAQGYDAAYLLAYGLAAGGGDGTGTSLSEGLKRMSGGGTTPVGPAALAKTLTDLSHGGSISFVGAAGSYRFDPVTGESPNDVDVWCIGRDASGPLFRSSGQYFDYTAGKIAGSFTECQ
jgi:branched-chain amino acid transport system substrate-binding protein